MMADLISTRWLLGGGVSSLDLCGEAMILHVLFAMLVGWIQRHQQRVITPVHKENGVLKAQLRGR
jgi:hypothetical protein